MNKSDGGQAFPGSNLRAVDLDGTHIWEPYKGMTLRDYIAIHATDTDVYKYSMQLGGPKMSRQYIRYAFADAMISERS